MVIHRVNAWKGGTVVCWCYSTWRSPQRGQGREGAEGDLEQVGGAGQEEGDIYGVWERVKSQREVSRFGKNTRKVQPGWSWGSVQTEVGEVFRAFCPYEGPISLFQEHWEAAGGFQLGRDMVRFWLRKTSRHCVETGRRVGLGAMVVMVGMGIAARDGAVVAGGEK